MTGKCELCEKTAELQLSHILPGAFFKWLKKTSSTGFLRFAEVPNKRVQDGFKL